ncbi:MAG: sulfite exporter TauE/SafE family protein [Clostridiales bacterium]|nr:sulfite exporter TauE/SafE family protein [Clostridiales bacterium]
MEEVVRSVLFLLTIFVSNTIQVITGFAGAMLAMPPSIRLIGVEPAKAILNIVSGASCIWVVVKNWRSIDYRELLKIILLMGIGLVAGAKLFHILALDILLKCYGMLIILIALKKMFIRREFRLPRIVLYGCLLAAGLIHGLFVSGGSFLVVYAVWALQGKEKFRSTVSAVWIILNTYLLYDHYQAGYFTPEVGSLLVMSIAPFLLAVWLGNRMAEKISTEKFLKLTYVLLLASGILVLV